MRTHREATSISGWGNDYVARPLSVDEYAALSAKYEAATDVAATLALEARVAYAKMQAGEAEIAVGERAGEPAHKIADLRAEVIGSRAKHENALGRLRVANTDVETLKSEIQYAVYAFQMAAQRSESDTSLDYPTDAAGHLTPEALRRALDHVVPHGSRISNELPVTNADPTVLHRAPMLLMGEPVDCDDPRALNALKQHLRARGDSRAIFARVTGF